MSVMKRIDTLVLITDRFNRILLGMKKRGFGSGKWNGFGGKVEINETIEEAAKRECKEECNLDCNRLQKVGVMSFRFIGPNSMPCDKLNPKYLEIHVFHTQDFSGEVAESDEMSPKWFPISDIPYDQMWADDKIWLPLVLKGSHFRAFFTFFGQSDIKDFVVQQLPPQESQLEPLDFPIIG